MDHKSAYAHHIAQAIRHKKAMAKEPKEELEQSFMDETDTDLEELPPENPDPKVTRKERIKAILAR